MTNETEKNKQIEKDLQSPKATGERAGNYLDPFGVFNAGMNRAFDDFMTGQWPFRFKGGDFADQMMQPMRSMMGNVMPPRTDFHETEDAYTIDLELPGVSSQDVDVTQKDGEIIVTAEKLYNKADHHKHKPHYVERRYGMFQRRFTLPENADGAKLEQRMENGLLTLVLPKV